MPYLKDKEESKISICPGCKVKHKFSKAGDYCNMTCYYKVNL